MRVIDGGITRPIGFRVAGVRAGLKENGEKDVALLVSDVPAVAKATFTTNSVKAAPVLWDLNRMEAGRPLRAVVINSGNANACTGAEGDAHVRQMAAAVADKLNITAEDVFVSSTGVIGVPLPIDAVCRGIETAASLLARGEEADMAAATAIMTTDTRPKQIAVEIELNGRTVRVAGMAKGSGMIHPNMATMLSYVTTDAVLEPELMEHILRKSVQKSYNMISVDGDTSTNDTVLFLANGMAENARLEFDTPAYREFEAAIHFVNTYLAKAIIRDGEGATKFLEVQVSGADTEAKAGEFARAVISSNLVKTAFFGADANWGRMVAAMGAAAELEWNRLSISIESKVGLVNLMSEGSPVNFDEEFAKKVLSETDISVQISVGNGLGTATAWGCDLSYDYVKINGDYRT
ncbi:bifunctional glutamate N-acetyltransferase/amino-acid acetyltransferase ArgJ [Alicyclobacillus sp. SO9]|uniref:bifunctional glutamate N-acetyltransferase/amino-acid acetyltransferase ArgJ n=1 Tax=Alicyclobacillus sp. SO9 TaxID=2665646 RepID=UPI0018E8F383|nr:bifunctional glutamate N-acetyltransferase/amino-acid acetyltransferase ArgJ [Alicyclobacillus sp. SO9]